MMNSNINLYKKELKKLINQRCKLDARIDFVSELIHHGSLDLEFVFRDKLTGDVVERVY